MSELLHETNQAPFGRIKAVAAGKRIFIFAALRMAEF